MLQQSKTRQKVRSQCQGYGKQSYVVYTTSTLKRELAQG